MAFQLAVCAEMVAPAFFQAPRPPSRWATGIKPMSCAVLVASAERQAPAQKKMNLLPLWK